MKFKKAFLALLTGALVMGSSITAFAADDPTKDVTGSYAGSTGTPVYEYEYGFGDMVFSYSGAAQGTWNPKTHQYEGSESKGGWTCATGSDVITVTNHSNAPVTVMLSFQSAISGVDFGFTEPKFDLESAVGTDVSSAPSKTVHVGALSTSAGLSEGQTGVKIGTITLHVSPK